MNLLKYQRGILNFDGGNWMPVRIDLLNELPWEQVVFLSFLINYVSFRLQRGNKGQVDSSGWVRITDDDLKGRLHVSRDKILRLLNGLKRAGLVHVHKRGIPPKRWCLIDLVELRKLTRIEGGKSASFDCGKSAAYVSGESAAHTIKPKLVSKHCPGCARTEWSEFGKQLLQAVCDVQPGTTPKGTTPRLWGEVIKRLHTTDDVAVEKIQEALTWYTSTLRKEGNINVNGNPNKLPICYSGEAFRKKWVSVQGAMARARHVQKRRGPKVSRVVED